MTAEALGRRVLTRTRCVALGKLNSLDLGSLVYLMRRLDHILSAKVPFLVPSSIKCVCVGGRVKNASLKRWSVLSRLQCMPGTQQLLIQHEFSPLFPPLILPHTEGEFGGKGGRKSLCGQSQCEKLGDAEKTPLPTRPFSCPSFQAWNLGT